MLAVIPHVGGGRQGGVTRGRLVWQRSLRNASQAEGRRKAVSPGVSIRPHLRRRVLRVQGKNKTSGKGSCCGARKIWGLQPGEEDCRHGGHRKSCQKGGGGNN